MIITPHFNRWWERTGVKKAKTFVVKFVALLAYRAGYNLRQAHVKEAEWLIRELLGHEGAEGWSVYLLQRLEKFQFQTKEGKKP